MIVCYYILTRKSLTLDLFTFEIVKPSYKKEIQTIRSHMGA